MSKALADKVILVTGAGRRIGAAIARHLHGAGATLAIHYRSSGAQASALAAELDAARAGSAFALQADLLDVVRLPELVSRVLGRCGRLDALVNNASTFYATPVGDIREAHWDELVGSNLKAPLFLAQAAAPALSTSRGTIVNIVDIHAERPLKNFAVYCAAKAGLAGLTRALAVELAPEVRVNGVAPGAIEWPQDGTFAADERRAIIEHALLRRIGEPADIARAVGFLLTDAPYVTGQIIAVDGGRSAHL
jgi:pteridine reductase